MFLAQLCIYYAFIAIPWCYQKIIILIRLRTMFLCLVAYDNLQWTNMMMMNAYTVCSLPSSEICSVFPNKVNLWRYTSLTTYAPAHISALQWLNFVPKQYDRTIYNLWTVIFVIRVLDRRCSQFFCELWSWYLCNTEMTFDRMPLTTKF